MSVTIQVPIPDELIPVLEERAQLAGLPRDAYLTETLSRILTEPRTLDEVLARFRQEVQQSGLTDEELDDLFKR